MTKTVKVYHIICEGNSENAYLNELNKHMRNNCIELTLQPHVLNGISTYKDIKNKYNDVTKKHKKKPNNILIWLDNDLFKRGDFSKDTLQKKLGGFSGIKYSHENFEDFLIMHLSDEQVKKWHIICEKNNHFDAPMYSKDVDTLIKEILPGYSKGSLPKGFEINDTSLKKLYENQKNPSIKFRCDLVDFIKQLATVQTDSNNGSISSNL